VATLNTSPEQAADAWASGLSAKTEKIKRGIAAVSVPPGTKAAAQTEVWASNTLNSKEKYRRNVQVPLADWQNAATAGADRVASAATAKKEKFAQKIAPVLAHIAAGLDRLPARGSFEQNKGRATAWMDYMHSYQRR
jgi:hypothetical protein